MTDIIKTISQIIEDQFPQIYREDSPVLIDFVTAYYEYMEQSGQSLDLTREMFNSNDIDRTVDDFLSHFQAKYLDNFPFVATTDKRFLVKNILDFYSAKGSQASIKLLMRLLFQEDVDVYLPGQDILKPSDSRWFRPIYLELSYSDRTTNFINKQVTGSVSGATAIVESITTKRINGRLIDVVYLSGLQGNFQFGEFVTDDLTIQGAPAVLGSLTNIAISNGGQNNRVGDILNVSSNSGRQGKVRVTDIVRETGRVEFDLIDGGAGYALNGIQAVQAGHANILETPTDIFVSERVLTFEKTKFTDQEIADEIAYIATLFNPALSVDSQWRVLANETASSVEKQRLYEFLVSLRVDGGISYFYADINKNGTVNATDVALATLGEFDSKEYDDFRSSIDFINFEKVIQPLETVSLLSATDIFDNAIIGSMLKGVDADGLEVANAVIVNILGDETDASQGDIVVQLYTGTFGQQALIELAANTDMTTDDIGDVIEEGSIIDLAIPNAVIVNGPFQVGERVVQIIFEEDTGNTVVSSYGIGRISSIQTDGANRVLRIDPAWGTFTAGAGVPPVIGLTSLAEGTIVTAGVDIIDQGAVGRLAAIDDPTTIVVDIINGTFTQNKYIRSSASGIESQIQDSLGAVNSGYGATDVYLDGNSNANGIIDISANSYAIGYVTGQNTSSVGLHTISGTFYAGDIGNNLSREEIAIQILRIALNLDTPSNIKYQGIFDILTANNNALADINGNGTVTAADALAVVRGTDDGRFDEYINPKFFIRTVREELLSPPRDENGQIIQIDNLQLSAISQGTDASFDIGSIENEETVFLNTDLIGSNNVTNIPYLNVTLDGGNSSIGFIDSIDIINTYIEMDSVYVIETSEAPNLQLDEDFTSENAAGKIVDNNWQIYNSLTDTLTSDNRIVVQVSAYTGNEPFAIGDTITGSISANTVVVYKVHNLSKSLVNDITVYQGDFANAETANTDAALVSGKIVDWKERNDVTVLYLTDIVAGTSTEFIDSEALYVHQVFSANEGRFIRLGTANVSVITSSGYSNNESFVLVGGGRTGGNPLVSGIGSIETNASGSVTQVTVIQPGVGYNNQPSIDLSFAYTIDTYPGPATANNNVLLKINTDFGYGFPKLPSGDFITPIEDMLTSGNFTIGSITSLTSINPGSNYDTNPFINVYNRYVAGFNRGNFRLSIQLISGTGQFIVGENVTQTVGNVTSVKGSVKIVAPTSLTLERLNFNVAFSEGIELVGVTSGARASITGIEPTSDEIWGTNAIVDSDVIVAAGVATNVEVIDSGFGYLENENVTMTPANTNNVFLATGVANLENQGVGSGIWKTFNAHLNSNKKIRDSVYYQEFSYDVISRQSLDKYEDILKSTLHVAGTKMFGSVSIESEIDLKTDTSFEVDEIIEVLTPINTQSGVVLSSLEKLIRA